MLPASGSITSGQTGFAVLQVDVIGLTGGSYVQTFDLVNTQDLSTAATVTVHLDITGAVLDVSANDFLFVGVEAGSNPLS